MRLGTIAAAALVCLAAGRAQAEPVVKVAGVDVDLARGDWVALDRREKTAVSVEAMRGSISADEAAFALVEQGRARAIALISVTPSGRGRAMEWRTGCRAGTEQIWSAELRGGRPEDLQCAEASGAYRAESFFADWPAVTVAVKQQSLALPLAYVYAGAKIGTRTGRVMSIRVMAEPGFVGVADAPPESLLPTVSPAHASYALRLGERIRDCLYSIAGKMELPPVTFAADAPAGARIASSSH